MTSRVAFAHEATVEVDDGFDERFDERAPGGAITVVLCGTLEHEPPCPLAAHNANVSASGSRAVVRVVFGDSAVTVNECCEPGQFSTPQIVNTR
jgi:hypothetical protein